jgi:dihydrofolate reductase
MIVVVSRTRAKEALMRSLTYYVGSTIDGFIAAPDGTTSFFAPDAEVLDLIARDFPDTLPTHVRTGAGLGPQCDRFDTVVMGRRTYEPAIEQGIDDPYQHLRTFVVSASLPPSSAANVSIVPHDPLGFVRALKHEDGGDIWLAGGGTLAGALLDQIDELALKLYPRLAGTGVPLFATDRFDGRQWTVTDTTVLTGGMVLARYRR